MSTPMILWAVIITALIVLALFLPRLLGVVYIPHSRVGIIEKLWSSRGSLSEGRIIALQGEAGFQGRLLRGGLHFGLFPWQYRIQRTALVTVAEGRIGYVYARGGGPLEPRKPSGALWSATTSRKRRSSSPMAASAAASAPSCAKVSMPSTPLSRGLNRDPDL